MSFNMDEAEKLETKITFLEDFLQKLQAVVVEHTRQITHLERENTALKNRVKELSLIAANSASIPNEKPPHY